MTTIPAFTIGGLTRPELHLDSAGNIVLDSAATAGEGRQNLICAYLAVGVLAGLLANTLFGIWWLDPIVGLVIAIACVFAGGQTWHGEGCGCSECAIPEVQPSPSSRSRSR